LAVVSQLKGAAGYRVERLFRCLLLQVMEDLSDRDLARYLEENLAAKSFCGFPLSEPTPAYCLFTRVRTRIGPTRLSPLVATMRERPGRQRTVSTHNTDGPPEVLSRRSRKGNCFSAGPPEAEAPENRLFGWFTLHSSTVP
jgi:hypothetical protein